MFQLFTSSRVPTMYALEYEILNCIASCFISQCKLCKCATKAKLHVSKCSLYLRLYMQCSLRALNITLKNVGYVECRYCADWLYLIRKSSISVSVRLAYSSFSFIYLVNKKYIRYADTQSFCKACKLKGTRETRYMSTLGAK